MASLTLLKLKNWLKSSRGLTRDREDGNIDDTILLDAIHLAIRRTATDCDLLPTVETFGLVADQYEYPLPEDFMVMRSILREDSNGSEFPLHQITQEKFRNGHNTVDNTARDPLQFAYPIYKGRQIQFYVKAPDNYDFIEESRVTSETVRTVTDTGANFGRTLSGHRISPGDVVHNVTGDSYGYVEVLDLITAKKTDTCDTGTSSTQVVALGVDWSALNVEVDDIICSPSTGVPTTYAFVTEVSGNTLIYEAIRGSLTAFAVGTAIKVGKAQKIRLSTAAPHRGLRTGTSNRFSIGDAVSATITATTFTPTTCTGSSTTGASVGQEAIASGGSHGYITGITATTLTVTAWIGGVPADGETVTVRSCDAYVIETRPMIQPVIWLKPTPSSSDTPGTERMHVSYDKEPFLPTQDYEYLDIPVQFTDAFYACCAWQVSMQTGTHSPAQVQKYKEMYEQELAVFGGNIHQVARGQIITVWGNRQAAGIQYSGRGTISGHLYDTDAMLSDQNS
jgi:hypothetical protein